VTSLRDTESALFVCFDCDSSNEELKREGEALAKKVLSFVACGFGASAELWRRGRAVLSEARRVYIHEEHAFSAASEIVLGRFQQKRQIITDTVSCLFITELKAACEYKIQRNQSFVRA
jgi:hypothetical protein